MKAGNTGSGICAECLLGFHDCGYKTCKCRLCGSHEKGSEWHTALGPAITGLLFGLYLIGLILVGMSR